MMIAKLFGWILGLGTFVGAVYLLWSKKNEVNSIEDALEAQRLKQQIARDTATVADMLVKGEIALHERAPLEAIIHDSKLKAAAILTDTDLEGKSETEIAAIFARAGF